MQCISVQLMTQCSKLPLSNTKTYHCYSDALSAKYPAFAFELYLWLNLDSLQIMSDDEMFVQKEISFIPMFDSG